MVELEWARLMAVDVGLNGALGASGKQGATRSDRLYVIGALAPYDSFSFLLFTEEQHHDN